jgi:hypothetical protein
MARPLTPGWDFDRLARGDWIDGNARMVKAAGRYKFSHPGWKYETHRTDTGIRLLCLATAFPFPRLAIGESFKTTRALEAKRCAARYRAMHPGWSYQVDPLSESEVRIWRTA